MFNFKKKIRFLTFTLLLTSIFFLPTRIATAQLKATLEGHTDLVWSVAFSPNGKMLASASWDQSVRLWNVNTGRLLHTLTGHTNEIMSVAFSPDGNTLASGSWDGTIRLWNPRNGKLKRTLTEHAGGVASVAFSPHGKTLASGSADRTIRLWNTTTWEVDRTLTGHTDVVEIVAFSPDSNTLASGSRDTTIRLWNPNNGRHKRTLTEHTAPVSTIAFSSDGNTLASGSRDQTIRLWNPNNGREKETLTGYTDGVNPVAFSPDGGATLLIGGRGISVWDTETGQYKKPFAGDIGGVLSVVFSPDGQLVASGSPDNKVRLWEFNVSDYEIPSITTNGMVRLVYLLPNDRSARPERVTALRQLIKDTQQLFADEMERHGYGRKTFSVETDKDGEPVVHHIDGKFPEEHYYKEGTGSKVWVEVRDHFDDSDLQHIPFVAIDLSSNDIHGGKSGGEATINFYSQDEQRVIWRQARFTEKEEALGGFGVIPVSGNLSEKLGLTAHELGHAFGLLHDFREGQEDTIMGGARHRLSKCSAEWLSASHFFNTNPISRNTPTDIELLSTQAYSQNTVSLRFKVTDLDGLHYAQLLLPEIDGEGVSLPTTMFDCKALNGKTNTIESVIRTAALIDRVTLQIMDVNGNITWATLPIELDAVVSDQNVLDINSDGIVNISDLTRIALRFGQRGQNPADVNEDRIVDTADLLLVAASLSSVSLQEVQTLVATDVQKWLADAKQLRIENEYQQKGIVFLEHLLAEIALLSKPTKTVIVPLTAIFDKHADLVNSVAFSPDGQTLATASRDRTIRLWDTHTSEHKTLLIGHTDIVNRIAFSPDGQTLASASPDTTIRLWDSETGEHKTSLRAHSGFGYIGFYSVAFSPDGQTLATGGDYHDPNIRLWNLQDGENIRTLTGHTTRIISIVFSPDGQTLASAGEDEIIRLWNPNTGKLKDTLAGHTHGIAIAFSPDGQILATAGVNQTIRLWNPNTGQHIRTFTGHINWANAIAFSPDGKTIACSGHNTIGLWNTQTGEYIESLEGHKGHIYSVVFSPDGQTLASGGEDGTVRLWELTPDDTPSDKITEDVNSDGIVNILDLVSVSSNFGQAGENIADVNGDGIVNIVDLVKVAGAMGAGAAAPTAHPQTQEILTAADVQHWLRQAQHANLTDATSQRGILMLQQLLTALIPKETSLLPNYPNPFNPETWIPYQLSESAEVTLHIYAVDGRLIRTLTLGHQPAGMYQSKSRAAYWDGRNAQGEPVASGVYFYTLSAGDFTATRKMLIRK